MEEHGDMPTSNFRYLSLPENSTSVDSVVLEFQVDPMTKKPIPSSLREVIRIGMPVFQHPIKQIVFYGKYLYIGDGDGSVQSATSGGGQCNDALSKIMRINPFQGHERPYTIPRSSPVIKVNGTRYLREIYALGFRDSHNLCFSRTGDLFLADVGRENVEEINLVKADGNYGWALREGPFVHLPNGGICTGVMPLPADEEPVNEYPVAAYGHNGVLGDKFVGQSIPGSYSVENRSLLRGRYFYANLNGDGDLYYSFLGAMRNAVTVGRPEQLTMARTYRPRIFFDHDDDPDTKPIQVANLRDIVRMDPDLENTRKVNLRFGRGKDGTLYWSSKANGRIYQITSTMPGAPV